MKKRSKKIKFQDKESEWVRQNLEKLVKKYAGKCIAISNQRVAGISDHSLVEAEKNAKKKFPKKNPLSLRVPHPEDFNCLL